jgi:hypothetical protein
MSELKACPYCGKEPKSSTFKFTDGISCTYVCCSNEDCPFFGRTMRLEAWQSRPLEDALQSRIDELVAFVGRVAKEQSIGYLPTSDPHIFEDAKLLAQRLIKESKK